MEKVVEETKSKLMHKEVGRSCASRAPRIGYTKHTWWSSANDSERRQLVSQEMREAEEEKRLATAVGQVKQGAWTKWDSAQCVVGNGATGISFLWRSTYDMRPSPANLSSWYDNMV